MMVKKLHYLWEKKLQYLHDNLKMQIIRGGKCKTHIMTLIHIIYGRGKCNTHIMTLIHIIYEGQNVKSIYQTWNTLMGIS
jgi:hypothetical protein